MLDGQLQRPLGLPQPLAHDGKPFVLEVRHDVVEALVLLADQVGLRHPDILEYELGSVRRVPSHLLERPAGLEAWSVLLHGENRDAAGALGGRVGPGGDEHQSAIPPLVMNILVPLMTKPSPSRCAVVLMAATSEPASGSVTAMAVSTSPVTIPGSQRAFCSSLPKLVRYGMARSVWTSTVMLNPPNVERPSSSANTTEASAPSPFHRAPRAHAAQRIRVSPSRRGPHGTPPVSHAAAGARFPSRRIPGSESESPRDHR